MEDDSQLTSLPETIQSLARKRYVADYLRIVTRPFGVVAPNFLKYLEEEYDRMFLQCHGIAV